LRSICVGKAGLGCGRILPVQHRDLGTGARQVVGTGHADDTAAKNKDFHRIHHPVNKMKSKSMDEWAVKTTEMLLLSSDYSA
jgi:hypothetical protein